MITAAGGKGDDRGAPNTASRAGLFLDRSDRPPVTPVVQPTRCNRTLGRLRQAMPTPSTAFLGALLWGATMGASALVNLLLDYWVTPDKIRTVSLLFAGGGALAFPAGLFAARLLSLGRGWEVAVAAALVCLAAATIALTAGLYALQYRSYYAEWHAPVFTLTWGFSSSSRWRWRATSLWYWASGSIFRLVSSPCLPPASGLRGSGVEHFARLC